MSKIMSVPQISKFPKFFGFLTLLFSFLVLSFSLLVSPTYAQVPQIKLPCTDTKDPDFHSLRPDQAAPCGDANKALYCSNDLQFIEDFDVKGKGNCQARGIDGTFECNPNLYVPPHDLFVTLDDSQFPIEGNTENVKNSQNSTDEFDDATKVNEYVSWYLSGVNNRAEYGIPTEDQIVNYSGPIQKLIPQAIQQAVRVSSIEKATKLITFTEEADSPDQPGLTISGPETHNQVVVCAQNGKPVECKGGKEYRLKDWEGSLSFPRTLSNTALAILNKIPGIGGAITNVATDAWNSRKPPLPWSDKDGIPFKTTLDYNKAYNEWLGKSCVIVPLVKTLLCFDNPGVTNEYADLFSYVPLAVTPDKKGAEYITDVQIKPAEGTGITGDTYGKTRNAPLYFAHTAETKDASALLNTTYAPKDVKSVPLPKSTETNNCSIVNVRTNAGDNLFPGDPDEMQVQDVSYTINQAKCEETHKVVEQCYSSPAKCNGASHCCGLIEINELKCNAEVFVTILTKTKTPFAQELFSQTVADSMSTFRKIYPKVDENAPVYCIADTPTVTNVTYDTADSQIPVGGGLTFKLKKNPKDGAEDSPQLAFPHIGSVYDYFLKGIQTALRPKGYGGEQPISAQTCTNISCGELPKSLPKGSGSCSLGATSSRIPSEIPQSLKDIISAAAETYKVPPNLIVGAMFGEGLFETGRFNWTDQNVKNWATCMKVPNCVEGDGDDHFMGFFPPVWANIKDKIAPDLKKLDPTRKEPSQCNLLDAVYGVAWNLRDSADGSPFFPVGAKCNGIPLNRGTNVPPLNCTWSDESWYNSAIRVSEFGTGWGDTSAGFYTCATKPNSCLTGGGEDAQCETDTATNFDTCGTGNNSHNACFLDVAHGR